MVKEFVFENLMELETPVGFFAVFDGDQKIPFSVEKNCMSIPAEVRDKEEKLIGTIQSNTNYDIVIAASKLEIGKEYIICFSDGVWNYCSSDEHTTCYFTVIDNWAIGIGAYDPNDQSKDDQTWEYSEKKGYLKQRFLQPPPYYDESEFRRYTVEPLDDSRGYKFKIFDREFDYVWFEVAWIEINEFPIDKYESALGLWLC